MGGRYQKRDRLARLVFVQNLLSQHPLGLTAQQVADRIGVNVRTAYRDLHALEGEVHMPIWEDKGRFGVLATAFLPPLSLTLSEAVRLYLSARLMARFSDRRDDDVIHAYGALAAVLPNPIAQHIYSTMAVIGQKQADERYSRVLDTLVDGWAKGRRVRIRYAHSAADGTRTTNERTLAPYFIEPHPGGHSCYVLGHDSLSGELRTFKLERIDDAALTDESFEVPDSFNAQKRLRDSWIVTDETPVEVRLLFHDPVAAARARENRWHTSQKEVRRDDGRLELRFTVAGLVEIRSWILGWGDTVEVLQPRELRAEIGRAARDTAARYA